MEDKNLNKKFTKKAGVPLPSFLNKYGYGSHQFIHMMLKLFLPLLFVTCVIAIYSSTAQAARIIHVVDGDDWYYFKGNQKPPIRWNYPGMEHSKWLKGRTGLGYGARNFRTYLGDMKGNYLSVYAVRDLIINDPSTVKRITFSLDCDGPFVVYLNGKEAIRNPVPVPIQLDLSGLAEFLVKGENVVAVQCSNEDINSDDFSFVPVFDIHDK